MRGAIGILAVLCVLAVAAAGAAPTPAAAARPSLKIGEQQLSETGLKVKLSCEAAPCEGTVTLVEVAAGKKAKTVLAQGTYSIPAGHQKSVTAKLTARGRSLLRSILKGKANPVAARLTATVAGGATQTQSLKFP